jgi:hypothetical protein
MVDFIGRPQSPVSFPDHQAEILAIPPVIAIYRDRAFRAGENSVHDLCCPGFRKTLEKRADMRFPPLDNGFGGVIDKPGRHCCRIVFFKILVYNLAGQGVNQPGLAVGPVPGPLDGVILRKPAPWLQCAGGTGLFVLL